MISILRRIKKLIIDATVSIKFATWTIDGVDIDRTSNILFYDGLISLNSAGQSLVHQVQAEKYGFIVDDGEEVIKTHSLVDGDLFLGRIDNYLLFKGGNLDISCKELNINAETVNINATDLNLTSTNINVTGNFTLNGVSFSVTAGKLSISGKEIAVVGGTVNLTSGLINGSGQ